MVCDSEPEVAVTVMVEVTGEEPPPPGDPAPHPVSRPMPAKLTASSKSTGRLRRFLQTRQHNAIARADPGSNGRLLRWSAAVVAAVLTVNVVNETPAGVGTVSAEKLHVAPAGNPAQVNETLELKPFSSCTVIVVVALCPDWTDRDAGLIATAKSGGMV